MSADAEWLIADSKQRAEWVRSWWTDRYGERNAMPEIKHLCDDVDALAAALAAATAENERLIRTLESIDAVAHKQGVVEWMHFHEIAMADPFKAESEAQDFAFRIVALASRVPKDSKP